jgi:hypothetical protein
VYEAWCNDQTMQQRVKDAQIKPHLEEYAGGTERRGSHEDAAVKGVEIMPRKEEYAKGKGQTPAILTMNLLLLDPNTIRLPQLKL